MKKSRIFCCMLLLVSLMVTACATPTPPTVSPSPVWQDQEAEAVLNAWETRVKSILDAPEITKIEFNANGLEAGKTDRSEDAALINRWKVLLPQIRCSVIPWEDYTGNFGFSTTFYQGEKPLPLFIGFPISSILCIEEGNKEYMLSIDNFEEIKDEWGALLNASGVYTYETAATYNPAETPQVPQESLDILARIDNVSAYATLAKKTIDFPDFIEMNFQDPYVTHGRSQRPELADIDSKLSVECLRKTENGILYSLHPVKQGGVLLIFYDMSAEIYLSVHNWFYITKGVRYNDFSSVSEGSSIDDVIKIDPSAKVFKDRMKNAYDIGDKKFRSFSMHYLLDGILTIFYNYNYDTNQWIMTSLEYEENYQVNLYGLSQIDLYDGHVLPLDALAFKEIK